MSPRGAFTAALLFALLAPFSCSEPPRPRSLVLCVVDTLREDGVQSMPFLHELGREGVRFENVYATSSWTRPSLASIFTGEFPSEHGVQEPRQPLPSSALTLAEALSERGYRTRAIVSNPILKEKWGYAQGFDLYDDELCLGPQAVTSGELAARALAELEELQRGDEPFFLFLLLFDPHWEYRDSSAGEERQAGRLDGSQRTQELSRMELTAPERRFVRELYEAELDRVDRALAEIERAVRSDVVFAVTADHGECLGEPDGFFGHVENLREEVVHVPLVFRGGLGRAEVERTEALSLANLPGLLWLELGLGSEAQFARGRPALFEVNYLPTQFRSAARTKRAGIREGRWKLVLDDLAETSSLYDMAGEGERQNVADQHSEILRDLSSQLRAAQGNRRDFSEGSLTADDLKSLRGLGYADEK